MTKRRVETPESVNVFWKKRHYVTVNHFFLDACWHMNSQHQCKEEAIERAVAAFEGPDKTIPDNVLKFMDHLESRESLKKHERKKAKLPQEARATA